MTDRDPIQTLWKDQTQEPFTMSLAEIHARADKFQSRIRFRNVTEYAAAGFVVAAFGYVAALSPSLVVKLGAALLILGAFYVVWRLHTLAKAANVPDAARADDLASFHRDELVRQRDALRSVWRWYLGPFVPGMVVFIAGTVMHSGAPWYAALAIAAVALAFQGLIFWLIGRLNMRAADKLQAEIDALDRARRE